MVCKKLDSQKREFKGVNFDLLASGKKSMVTKMNFKTGDNVPFHSHPNEQAGYIISGKIIIKISGESYELNSGDSYVIPENIEHSVEVIETGEVIDVFTPPRKDYE